MKYIKIAHYGSYDRNVGDNIAIYNIRKCLESLSCDAIIEWTNINANEFYKNGNNIDYCKKRWGDISKNHDCIIVGGGGLIQGTQTSFGTGGTIPFNKEIYKNIDIPVVFFAVGINYFRGSDKFTDKGKKSLEEALNGAEIASLRNDGSIKSLEDLNLKLYKNIHEVPDPGLIFDYNKPDTLNIRSGLLQPALNGKKINLGRFTASDISVLKKLIDDFNLRIIPHTKLDFQFLQKNKYTWKEDNHKERALFSNIDNTIKEYLKYDFVIGMRGHGQLCPIGLNMPSIYFSTQDKVRDFSYRNGFSNYNVDARDKDRANLLTHKVNLLMNDKDYLNNWYTIRNKNMSIWKKQFTSYCEKIIGLF